MKKTAPLVISLLSIVFFTACSTGGAGNSNPTISANVVESSVCTNMINNQQCSIQLSFNNGANTNPVLASNINTPTNPSGSGSIVNPGITASGAYESSMIACQQKINGTPNNTNNACTIQFSWTTQTESSTTGVVFNLNGISSNTITVSGD